MAIDLSGFSKPIDSPQSFSKRLPAGAYVCIIRKAQVVESEPDPKLILFIDIARGDFKNFFMDFYQKNGEWNSNAKFTRYITKNGVISKSYLKLISDMKKSNASWDYNDKNIDGDTFKNKFCGFIFGEEEYKDSFGAIKNTVKVKFSDTIDNVLSGKSKIPDPVKLPPPRLR